MSEQVFAVSVPAEPCYLRSIRGFFKPILEELFGEEHEMLILALDESCSNVLRHRCPEAEVKVLTVSAELHNDHVCFRIENFCDSGDVPKIKPRELVEVRPGGLGTHFVSNIMDDVRYEPHRDRPDQMTLVLEKVLPSHSKDR